MKRYLLPLACTALVLLLSVSLCTQPLQAQSKAELRASFQTPPPSARPRVWWHWMQGNITQEGIRKDLLWMQRSGIGGFQNFDAGLATPQVVTPRLAYMTPAWQDAFRLATRLADSLKLEMAIAASPGWSQSGGPWVSAKDGMKKLVWSELRIKGDQPFSGVLPHPPTTTGNFQNVLAHDEERSTGNSAHPPHYYQDIAVLAYRLPEADVTLAELAPTITASAGKFTLAQLSDGDLMTTELLPSDSVKGAAWVQFDFRHPQAIQAVTVVGGGTRSVTGIPGPSEERSLEASDDGINFRRIVFIPLSVCPQQTISFPTTTARFFRITFKNPRPAFSFSAMVGGSAPKPLPGTAIAELVLHPVSRVNRFEEKAGFGLATNLASSSTPVTADVVAESDIINLTGLMKPGGQINWTPRAGHWKIVRFGYSLTGKVNQPASPEATGLEVDKLDAEAVKKYLETYLNQYKAATGGLMGNRGLQYLITDSYEAGPSNWTPAMAQEFQKRRGYSLIPWLPVLTGTVVRSAEASDGFLWDYRQTLAELIAENYYDQLTTLLRQRGMKRYSESHESGRAYIADGMDVKRTAAIPMSAMWALEGAYDLGKADIRESASVAHLYGQNLVAAESFTAVGIGGMAYSFSPEKLKPTADLELASGLNRFVIHTTVHQPTEDKIPGLGLGPYGQWFTRHETWANQAKVWTDYLARSSYLLQQGKFVADIAYFYGEDNNIVSLFGKQLPNVPEGYSYDFINPHALINLLSVKNGKLVTPSGMNYRFLHLDENAKQMSLPVLRKLVALVKAGATISGSRPERSPSLADDQQEFKRLVAEIWGKNLSSGRIFTGLSVPQVLDTLRIQPDFQYTKRQIKTSLLYVHRQRSDGDIFWVNNRNDGSEQLEVTFRMHGKVPQLWHPETGLTEPASYTIADGRTTVSINFAPNDAVFVLFLEPALKTTLTLPKQKRQLLTTLEGAWQVSFQANRGAPAQVRFDTLASYTKNPAEGIRYFSGTATYTKSISMAKKALDSQAQVWLDLGDVKNLAQVSVNGKLFGAVWKKPFQVNITSALKEGENSLIVHVTNLWVNRLIGDQQPGVQQKITFTTMPFFKADSRLTPSGLLGPVKLFTVQ